MKKAPAPYFWRNIHYDQFLKWPNQYMWWDVYYNYMDDFNSYGANALLLFDQRELERDNKEEKEDFEFTMKKRDKNLQIKRRDTLVDMDQKDLLNKMVKSDNNVHYHQYCWVKYQNQRSKIPKITDWQYWF